MTGKMRVFKPGQLFATVFEFDRALELRDITAAVGGYLETVPYFHTIPDPDVDSEAVKCIAFCDEEGKLKGLPLNRVATMLWSHSLAAANLDQQVGPRSPMADVLVGPIAVVSGDDEFMAAL